MPDDVPAVVAMIDSGMTVSAVAARMGISERHLHRRFSPRSVQALTGRSVREMTIG